MVRITPLSFIPNPGTLLHDPGTLFQILGLYSKYWDFTPPPWDFIPNPGTLLHHPGTLFQILGLYSTTLGLYSTTLKTCHPSLAGEGVCFAVPPGPGWIKPDKGQGHYQEGARGDQRAGAQLYSYLLCLFLSTQFIPAF